MSRTTRIQPGHSEQSVKHVPYPKAASFAEQEQQGCLYGFSPIEAKRNAKHIAYERYPGYEGQPYSPLIYDGLLFCQGLGLDLEPLLYPFPLSQPAHGVGQHTAEPIAQGACDKAAEAIACYCQYGKIQRV